MCGTHYHPHTHPHIHTQVLGFEDVTVTEATVEVLGGFAAWTWRQPQLPIKLAGLSIAVVRVCVRVCTCVCVFWVCQGCAFMCVWACA